MPKNANSHWFVYIIEAEDGSYYTGISTNVDRRFQQHRDKVGAKYFQGRTPLSVVFQEGTHTRSSASKRELQIKQLSRAQKKSLVAASHQHPRKA